MIGDFVESSDFCKPDPTETDTVSRMKTRLWATLTASGGYARASAEQPPRPEALADFAASAAEARNFIVGRTTFEAFQSQPGRAGGAGFDGAEIVVVTSRPVAPAPVTAVASPRAALEHLARRGAELALVAGGARLHDAFLAEGLADELVIVVAPVLAPKDLQIALPERRYGEVTLRSVRELGGGVVRLHYDLRRTP